MSAEVCPKCGAAMIPGQLGVKGTLWKFGFKPDSSGLLGRRSDVYASACPACGYVELRVTAADTGKSHT